MKINRITVFCLLACLIVLMKPKSGNAQTSILKKLNTESAPALESDDIPKAWDMTPQIGVTMQSANGKPLLLYFNPNEESYESYEEQLQQLIEHPLLKNRPGQMMVQMFYFNNKSANETKRGKFTYNSQTFNVFDQQVFVFNVNPDRMKRLMDKYASNYVVRKELGNGAYQISLTEGGKCPEKFADRIAMYNRAIRELIDPEYSSDEKFASAEATLNEYKIQNDQKVIELNARIDAANDELTRRIAELNAEIVNKQIKPMKNQLMRRRFDFQLQFGLAGQVNGVDEIEFKAPENGSRGFLMQMGQQIELDKLDGALWFNLGFSSVNQNVSFTLDSMMYSTPSIDPNGVSYTANYYILGQSQSVRIRRNSIPMTFSYELQNGNSSVILEPYAGFGMTLINEVDVWTNSGTMNHRGVYEGFNTEISNIAALGLQDGIALETQYYSASRKALTLFTILGLRMNYKLFANTSLQTALESNLSGNLLKKEDHASPISAFAYVSALKQNPLVFSVGLTHRFHYEK